MHIFCTKCGKHIDVSLEELENQEGHLVCPQCLAEIDVDVDLFNGNAPDMPSSEPASESTVAPNAPIEQEQRPPAYSKPPEETPSATPASNTPQAATPTASGNASKPPHIDDVMRYCKHCGAFLREGVNFCPKCGKYVRVTAPPPAFKPPLTPAQQEAARLRGSTPPVKRIPANKQSNYQPPQDPTLQDTNMGQQQRNPLNPVRNSGNRRSSASNKNSGPKRSKFSIYSIGGCLTLTLVAVALFFIVYIIIGVTSE